MKLFLLLTSLWLMWTPLVWGLDATQVSKTLRITYDEPTTNADATPLLDLGGTTLRVTADGVDQPIIDVPASAPTGGGSIAQDVTVPFTPNRLVSVDLAVTAYDTSGNVSEIEPLNITLDWLPPGKVN